MTVTVNTVYNEKCDDTVQGFVNLANSKYTQLKKIILRQHPQFNEAVSLKNISPEMGEVAAIVMVRDKRKTRKGDKYLLTCEDPTGETKVLVKEHEGETIVEDDVIAVKGNTGTNIIFANQIKKPDTPLRNKNELPTTKQKRTAVFISDLHFGSKNFRHRTATKFVRWANKNKPDHILIAGDVVEGVGIYPDQDEELEEEDVYAQFDMFEDFVQTLPNSSNIVIGPGNHDPVRLAEPQPPIPKEYCPSLHEKKNVTFVPSPAYVTLDDTVTVLMYHGTSFDEHVDKIKKLREKAYEQPELAMVDWLRRRHLCPSYGDAHLTPKDRDDHVISPVPDVIHIGHTHSFAAANYKGTKLICSSTFQGQTPFQKRVGHKPEPGKVAEMNLQNREVTVHNLN